MLSAGNAKKDGREHELSSSTACVTHELVYRIHVNRDVNLQRRTTEKAKNGEIYT